MKTKERLSEVLKKENLTAMAEKAMQGYYDDYETKIANPQMQLVFDLRAIGRYDLAKRAMNGEWGGTMEEAEEWMEKEGKFLL